MRPFRKDLSTRRGWGAGASNAPRNPAVKSDQLSETRPPDPAETAAPDESLVANSDDFTQHRKAFAKAAAELIASGRCTKAEFEEMGGWIKSSNHRDAPVYFTYCGGMNVANRIYLDASSGRVF